MCINVDWNTLILTTITSCLSALAGAGLGAYLAFNNDKKLEEDKTKKEEMNHIFSYYGYLINLFHGYDKSANSFKDNLMGYHIENNLSKIQNSKRDWGCLNFVMKNSNKLFEKTFALEKDIDVCIEKANLYTKEAGKGDSSLSSRVIAMRQFTEVYKEIIAMLINYDNYSKEYYKRQIITDEVMNSIKNAQELSDKLVNEIYELTCPPHDNDAYLKRIEDKKDWNIQFGEGKEDA